MHDPGQADRIISTLSAVPFEFGNYTMELFVLRKDATCVDGEWRALREQLGGDSASMDRCDQIAAFAALIAGRQQRRESEIETARWIRKSSRELIAQFPSLSRDGMLQALGYMTANVYSPEAAANERATCKATTRRSGH